MVIALRHQGGQVIQTFYCSPMPPEHPRFEFWLILTVGLVQFINICDFMMVMPLGPDFAMDLGIPTHQIGLIGGIYTFAAAITGFAGALFLDNFCRKRVLLVTLLGLLFATALAALAWNKESLLAARILAGVFGGPLTSSALALIADCIPPERRGAAIGKVMGAFAAASVIGVPFGLQLAHWYSWKTPFLTLSAVGLIVLYIAWRKLPSGLRPIPQTVRQRASAMRRCLSNPVALTALGMMACAMMAGFMIVPNIAAHLQMNLGFPREQMGLCYFLGGSISLFGMRLVGRWVDRYSATIVSLGTTLILSGVLLAGFIFFPSPIPVIILFALFMLAMSGRNVAAQSLASRVPAPHERAGYMSVQSSVTHLAMALGSGFSSLVLHEQGGALIGVPWLGSISLGLSLLVPAMFWYVERGLRRRINALTT